ncbi:MAG: hypothetical protein Kow0047_14460 [Anaerolineae bacterium]
MTWGGIEEALLRAILLWVLLTPAALTLLAANLAPRRPSARYVALALMAAQAGVVLVMGVGMLAAATAASLLPPDALVAPMPLDARDLRSMGGWSVLTGLVALGALLPPARQLVARWQPGFSPDNVLHAVSLSLAVIMVGSTLIQGVLVQDLGQATRVDGGIGLSDIWAQGVALTVIGLIGIGWGTRRSWREVWERLGMTPVTGGVARIAATATVALLALDVAYMWLWQRLDPAGAEQIARVSGLLFGDLANVPGALSVGITAAISEEIIYRGALQPRFGLLTTAALFALSHVQYGVSPATVEVFIIGVVLGVVRRRTGLTACMLIHLAYNALNLLLLWQMG